MAFITGQCPEASCAGLVEVAAGEHFVPEREADGFNHCSCPGDEGPYWLVRRKSEYHVKCDRSVFRLRVLFEDFSALNKSQVGVELLLKDRLVSDTVGPVQVVANREDDMPGLAVDTENVHHVGLFDGHWLFYTRGTRTLSPVG